MQPKLMAASFSQRPAVQVFVCRSGSAADTQNMSAYVRYFLHQHQMELEEPLVEVKTAARLAQQLIYQNKVLPKHKEKKHLGMLGKA